MKRETFVKVAKACLKGKCLNECPHREICDAGECRKALIRDAISLVTADDIAAQDQTTRDNWNKYIDSIKNN